MFILLAEFRDGSWRRTEIITSSTDRDKLTKHAEVLSGYVNETRRLNDELREEIFELKTANPFTEPSPPHPQYTDYPTLERSIENQERAQKVADWKLRRDKWELATEEQAKQNVLTRNKLITLSPYSSEIVVVLVYPLNYFHDFKIVEVSEL